MMPSWKGAFLQNRQVSGPKVRKLDPLDPRSARPGAYQVIKQRGKQENFGNRLLATPASMNGHAQPMIAPAAKVLASAGSRFPCNLIFASAAEISFTSFAV